jgi:phenylpropionate dioxygenase-like ring-hydroxylating dioxygenase large terminal subunit
MDSRRKEVPMSTATPLQVPLRSPGKYDHLVRPDGLVHRSIYTDPEIFKEEMTKVFGGIWVFLCHEAELPKPYDFKLITVGRRPTIVTRSAEGKIVAVLNRCSHRGSPVCLTERGNAKRFSCPYHGWTFENTGELVDVSFPDGYGPSFDLKTRNLGRFPRVESYRGYVFGSLNPDIMSLTEWLAPARELLDWTLDRDEIGSAGVRVVKGTEFYLHANWKQQNDNNTDGYHSKFVHASTVVMNRRRYGPGKWMSHISDQTQMLSMYLGNGHKAQDQRPEANSPWKQARPVPGRETAGRAIIAKVGEAAAERFLNLTGRAGINLVIYPNLFIRGNGNFAVYEPVAGGRTNVHNYSTLLADAPEEMNTLRLRFDEDIPNLVSRDDNAIMQRVQDCLETVPEMEWLDLSRGFVRQTIHGNGAMTSNKTDDTANRGGYFYWRDLMNRDVTLSVV